MNRKILSIDFVVFFCLAAINFFSCSNLNGSDFKDKLSNAIDYATSGEIKTILSSKDGKIAPSGEIILKHTDKINLFFSEYSGYKFLKWQTVNTKTKLPYTDQQTAEFFDFDDLYSPETNFTVLKLPKDIEIKPLCANRPNVLTYSPRYKASGTFKDSTIRVFFSHKISEESIYYSGKELLDLGINSLEQICWDGKNPESIEEISCENKVYAYKSELGPIFKNIKITTVKNSEETNIAEKFHAPYFEDSEILIIPVDMKNLPDTGTSVVVEISENFFYSEYNQIVNLENSVKWNYLVNSEIDDSDPPNVKNLFVYDSESKTKELLKSQDYAPENLTRDDLESMFLLKNQEIYFYAEVEDLKSLPSENFDVKIYQTHNNLYKALENKVLKKNYSFKYTNHISDTLSSFGSAENLQTLDLSNLGEGVFSAVFEFFDVQGNCSQKIYNFIVDKTGPKNTVDFRSDTDNESIIAQWTPDLDYYYAAAWYYKKENESSYRIKDLNSTGTKFELTGLESGVKYDVYIIMYDIFGNTSFHSTEYIRPDPAEIYLTGINTTNFKISWDWPSTLESGGMQIYYSNTPNFEDAIYDDYWGTWNSGKSTTIPLSKQMTPGTIYYLWFVTFNGSTKPNETEVKSRKAMNVNCDGPYYLYTQPEMPEKMTVYDKTDECVEFKIYKPLNGNADGYHIYIQDDATDEFIASGYISERFSINFFEKGKTYYIYAFSYAGSKDNESENPKVIRYVH